MYILIFSILLLGFLVAAGRRPHTMAGMTHPTLTLQHERLDDIPLLLGVLDQLRIPVILDRHLGSHHLHQGLANGTLAATWIAFILSEANHCKASVQDWARRHQHTLATLLQQELRPAEFSDDRLGIVLRRLHEADWAALERDLWQATCEVYELPCEGIRLDSTTTFGYHAVQAEGLLQFGHSTDHRPDLPQVKIMAAAAQPTSYPLASVVVPGQSADDTLYRPLLHTLRDQLGKSGLLYAGDCKMAALETRADIVQHQDYYLTVLPRTGDSAALIEGWIAEALAEKHSLQEMYRVDAKGKRWLFARVCELERRCEAEVGEEMVVWSERVQLVRTEALAQHHGEQLERRLQAAEAAVRQLTPAVGRGRRQQRQEGELREAVLDVLKEHQVEGLLQVDWRREDYVTSQGKEQVRYEITEVKREAKKIEAVKERYGWRVQVTNLPQKRCNLQGAVELYNGGWSMERSWHLVKDRPLGIQPLYVAKDDQVDGLTKLLMIALRVLTFIEVVVRGRLAERDEALGGLYEGQPTKQTARPTAVRLLRAIARLEMTVTRVELGRGTQWSLTPLPALLEQTLSLLMLPRTLYTKLVADTG
jgi:transposase